MLSPIFDPHNWAAVPFHFWSLVFFVFGSIVGSFLNVCIHRMPLGQSIVSPPSHCPHCRYSIPWFLNIPLVTWLYLGGKCKNCGAPISVRYFLVELLTALTFLGCWLEFGRYSPLIAIIYSIFLAGLIVATFIDFEHFIIPDEITIGGMIAGFVCSFLVPGLHSATSLTGAMRESLLGIAVGEHHFMAGLDPQAADRRADPARADDADLHGFLRLAKSKARRQAGEQRRGGDPCDDSQKHASLHDPISFSFMIDLHLRLPQGSGAKMKS